MTFDDETIRRVWGKGRTVGTDAGGTWRKDECGAWIRWQDYGSTDTDLGYGWEIDHITSVEHGGTDALSNLRPLQWKNNRAKQAGRLKCVVTSSGDSNVSVE